MSEPMEDKSLERGRATEKDRVRKALRAIMEFHGLDDEGSDYVIDSFLALILKEIKRAERREREECAKVAHSFRKNNMSVGKLQDLLKSEPTTKINIKADGTIEGHDPALSIASAIRNRRKV